MFSYTINIGLLCIQIQKQAIESIFLCAIQEYGNRIHQTHQRAMGLAHLASLSPLLIKLKKNQMEKSKLRIKTQ